MSLARIASPIHLFEDKKRFLSDKTRVSKEAIEFMFGLAPRDEGSHLDPDDYGQTCVCLSFGR